MLKIVFSKFTTFAAKLLNLINIFNKNVPNIIYIYGLVPAFVKNIFFSEKLGIYITDVYIQDQDPNILTNVC